ncbi:MAG: hypothetical protein M3Z01_05375 [Thermoproteota archaeon]|nr:hypothetical protein [Thermoproteota archaeon]
MDVFENSFVKSPSGDYFLEEYKKPFSRNKFQFVVGEIQQQISSEQL